jgi:hypothetical protein
VFVSSVDALVTGFMEEIADEVNLGLGRELLVESSQCLHTVYISYGPLDKKVYATTYASNGQIVVNSNIRIEGHTLKSVLRHEMGHALGLEGHEENPKAVMYKYIAPPNDPPSKEEIEKFISSIASLH